LRPTSSGCEPGKAWRSHAPGGKLRGEQPKLSDRQQKELRRMHDTGTYSISDLAELFSVSRPTVYRTLSRQKAAT